MAVEGFVGGSVILPCTLTPNRDIRWKQGITIILIKQANGGALIDAGPYNGDVSLVDGVKLRINSLNRFRDGDTGTGDKPFTCEYIVTGEPQEIQLRLLAKITGVSIPEASDGGVTVTVGKPKTFTCSVTGDPIPQPSYSWGVNDVTVDGQNSNSITLSLDKSTRTIKCTAINRYSNGSELSVMEATATLNVQYLDAPSISTVSPIIENDTATLRCSAEGNPPPRFQWWRNNTDFIVQSAVYTIESVQRSAAGGYTCRVNNIVGSYNLTTTLTVKYPPDVTVSYDKTTHTLTCTAQGVPDVYSFSQWEHRLDGKLLQTLGTESTGSAATLKLLDTLTYEDTGHYVCQVSNGIKSPQRGQVSTTPQCAAIFGNQSNNRTLSVGETKTISVSFYTYSDTPNVTVVWTKSGESTVLKSHREETGPVRLMIRGQIVRIEGTVTVLTLRDVTRSDEGNYTVTVTNDINGASQSHGIAIFVYVIVPPTNKPGTPNSDQNRSNGNGAAIGGGTAAAVAIVIVIIGTLLFRKHRMKSAEAVRVPEHQMAPQFQNGGQEGSVYQDLAINPVYVNATENQQYATLDVNCRQATDYEQCNVQVNNAVNVNVVVTNAPQYEDVSVSTKDEEPGYGNVETKDYENKTFHNETSTTYYNL